MNLTKCISHNIKALNAEDTVGHALDEFEKYPYDYLPVLKDGKFFCNLHRESLVSFSDLEKIENVMHCEDLFYAETNLSTFDLLRLFVVNSTNIMPVVEDGSFIGTIVIEDLMSAIGQTPFVVERGGVIVVRKPIREYSISEIAKIIESENAKILGLLTSDFVGDDVVLTIKINQMRLANIEAALKRFGYTIVESYHENTNIDNYTDRYKLLMSYLNL